VWRRWQGLLLNSATHRLSNCNHRIRQAKNIPAYNSRDQLVVIMCTPPVDPIGWSERRLRAMAITEAALQIKVIGTAASVDCDSLVNFRNCALLVDYRIENLTVRELLHSDCIAKRHADRSLKL
jgi:hypothetical protein